MRTHRERNKKLIRAGKATAFWYMSVFAAVTLVSPTFAGFTSSQEIEGTIEAGTWPVLWKHTDVRLTVANEEIESCNPIELKAKFTNLGKYETEAGYWKIEEKPADPIKIKRLESSENVILKFEVKEPGTYTFKAYQEGKHPSEILKKVTVTCEKEESENEVIEEELPTDESEKQSIEERPQKEEKQDNKPENNEKKDKEAPIPEEPQKPVETPLDKPAPPADNGNDPNEKEPAPTPPPVSESPAVNEETVNSKSEKDGEE